MSQETEEVKIEVPKDLVHSLDECVDERGFNDRSRFILEAIRDAVNAEDPFTEEAREQIREAREEYENGDTIPIEELMEKADIEWDE
jgi:metal-responsive CopG/Arc/MetJ family transcriptional regulator